MEKIEVQNAPDNSSTYQLDDGRYVRVHLRLLTPDAELPNALVLEVETTAYEVDHAGQFVTDANGEPVHLPKQRSRIALDNVRAGAETMKPGWAKVDLSYNPNDPREDVKDVVQVDNVPKDGKSGDRIYSDTDNATYVYSDGLYEQARQKRVGEFASLVAAPTAVPLSQAQLADLKP